MVKISKQGNFFLNLLLQTPNRIIANILCKFISHDNILWITVGPILPHKTRTIKIVVVVEIGKLLSNNWELVKNTSNLV